MTLRQIGAVVVCALVCALSVPAAEARPRQTRVAIPSPSHCVPDNLGRVICSGSGNHIPDVGKMVEGSVVGGRPAGCPRRYCGCGVSLKVFGRIIPELNLAANWLRKFPRTHAAAGMVAARRGHVFYIKAYNGDGTALAYDPNSGGGKTRIHVRSLRGYTVVDPNGSRVALR
jgi:hypothetical protein